MRVRVVDEEKFRRHVFGADSALDYWPELKTQGMEVKLVGEHYYLLDALGNPINDSAFFTVEEMKYLAKEL